MRDRASRVGFGCEELARSAAHCRREGEAGAAGCIWGLFGAVRTSENSTKATYGIKIGLNYTFKALRVRLDLPRVPFHARNRLRSCLKRATGTALRDFAGTTRRMISMLHARFSLLIMIFTRHKLRPERPRRNGSKSDGSGASALCRRPTHRRGSPHPLAFYTPRSRFQLFLSHSLAHTHPHYEYPQHPAAHLAIPGPCARAF